MIHVTDPLDLLVRNPVLVNTCRRLSSQWCDELDELVSWHCELEQRRPGDEAEAFDLWVDQSYMENRYRRLTLAVGDDIAEVGDAAVAVRLGLHYWMTRGSTHLLSFGVEAALCRSRIKSDCPMVADPARFRDGYDSEHERRFVMEGVRRIEAAREAIDAGQTDADDPAAGDHEAIDAAGHGTDVAPEQKEPDANRCEGNSTKPQNFEEANRKLKDLFDNWNKRERTPSRRKLAARAGVRSHNCQAMNVWHPEFVKHYGKWIRKGKTVALTSAHADPKAADPSEAAADADFVLQNKRAEATCGDDFYESQLKANGLPADLSDRAF